MAWLSPPRRRRRAYATASTRRCADASYGRRATRRGRITPGTAPTHRRHDAITKRAAPPRHTRQQCIVWVSGPYGRRMEAVAELQKRGTSKNVPPTQWVSCKDFFAWIVLENRAPPSSATASMRRPYPALGAGCAVMQGMTRTRPVDTAAKVEKAVGVQAMCFAVGVQAACFAVGVQAMCCKQCGGVTPQA